MSTKAWIQGMIVAVVSLPLLTANAANVQPSMLLIEQGVELNLNNCEYGRGSRVTESLKQSLTDSFIQYLANQARMDLADLLANSSTSTRVDSTAAIDFTQIASALKNHQQQLDFAEPYWQGNETCIQAKLILSPSAQQTAPSLNIDWQTSPTTVWQFSQAQVDMLQVDKNQQAFDAAMQQALQNSVSNNIQLVAEQGAGKFALLTKHANKIKLADVQNLFNDWQVLGQQQTQQNFTVQVLVSLNRQKLEQQLNTLVKKIATSSIYVSAEPFALKRQLLTLLTEHNITIANSVTAADMQVTAKSSMLEQANGYQNLIELEVTNLNKQIIWQWQNDPSLITVSNKQSHQVNQLIQAHMSLPQHQQTIIQQLEYLLIEQALIAK
ncbi:hypothetical protein [Catenovulum agarivorans]|uniref:hypothetical protein n=1 Tax=Catenovulum agarivorans TaxID=1172192 RepID=UPI0012F9D00C|nr:hypothetical protein [Catenovulum agarivorans]